MALRLGAPGARPAARVSAPAGGLSPNGSESDGIIARLRYAVWRQWLWLVALAAVANWKQWLAILGLALTTAIAGLAAPEEEAPEYHVEPKFAVRSPEFLSTVAGATDTPILPGNSIAVFNNGDEFYPAMLEAIASAERTITIEAYIYWDGEIGMRFAEALAARSSEGVTVKVLLDAVGSASIGDQILAVLERGGVEVAWYRPLSWYSIERVNNRTHRKSLVVDGLVGFTGGAGIADQWLGDAQDPEHWRDIQIRVEGPAVSALQTGFARNWLETTGELVTGAAYFPVQPLVGSLPAQTVLSSPETGSSTVRIMYLLSIAGARHSIYIANPYFVPDERAIAALIAAERRGVDVKIMLAGVYNDAKLARFNSTRLYGELIAAGVEIYEFAPTMLHQKYMVSDGIWTTVGTTNFDNRSFALNEESNVCVYDEPFASRFEEIFRQDLARCERIELDEWEDRGVRTRIFEMLAWFLRDQV